MQFKAVFWVWLNPTSTAAVLGDPLAGGQVHIAFSEPTSTQLSNFFAKTAAQKTGLEWKFLIEPYDTIPAQDLFIRQNAPSLQRSGEYRIPSQSPRSKNAHPLWQRSVVLRQAGTSPVQAMVVLKDTFDKFHVRLINDTDLYRFPLKVARNIFLGRKNGSDHLYVGKGVFDDIIHPATAANTVTGAGSSGSVAAISPATRPKPSGDAAWKQLSKYLQDTEATKRVRRVQKVERLLRNPNVRKNALLCFGERCQVRGCPFTATLSLNLITYILEVHHIKGVARGGSDALSNLTVLCANHHRLAEFAPNAKAVEVAGTDDVLITYGGGSFVIERDLSVLRDLLV